MSAPKNHVTCWKCGAPFANLGEAFWAHVKACQQGFASAVVVGTPPCIDCGNTGEPCKPGYGAQFRKDGRCGDCYEKQLARLRKH